MLRNYLFILFCCVAILAKSQSHYRIPRYVVDTTADNLTGFLDRQTKVKFDFSDYAVPLSFSEKTKLLKEVFKDGNYKHSHMIGLLFETFEEYLADSMSIQQIKKHFHYLKSSTQEIIIYDDMVYGLGGDQIIHIAIKRDSGWVFPSFNGCEITNAVFEKGELKSFDTFAWACCADQFNKYYRYSYLGGKFQLGWSTAISYCVEISDDNDRKLRKPIKIVNRYLKTYNICNDKVQQSPKPKEVFFEFTTSTNSIWGDYAYAEKEIDGTHYVLAEFSYYGNELYQPEYNRVLAWVKREDIQYRYKR